MADQHPLEGIPYVRLLRGDFTGIGAMRQVRVDPFPHLIGKEWNAVVKQAGFRVQSIVEVVVRNEGESDEDFSSRAERIAQERENRKYRVTLGTLPGATRDVPAEWPEAAWAIVLERAKGAQTIQLYARPTHSRHNGQIFDGPLREVPTEKALRAIEDGQLASLWRVEGVNHGAYVMPQGWEIFRGVEPHPEILGAFRATEPHQQERTILLRPDADAEVRILLERFGAQYSLLLKGEYFGDGFIVKSAELYVPKVG